MRDNDTTPSIGGKTLEDYPTLMTVLRTTTQPGFRERTSSSYSSVLFKAPPTTSSNDSSGGETPTPRGP